MEEIKSALRELLVDTLRLPIAPAQIGENDLITQLGIDSIGLMEIITQVENKFHIIVEEDDLSPSLVNSLDTFSAYVKAKQRAAAVKQ
ncbi:MAG: acyl carrier protein [Deltaproteobacteria bacterium]|nr:acyl carrier protein [Deltaproteobacteria bacterium]